MTNYELGKPATATKQQIWERKLLDFTLRNNLLNTRLGRRVVPIISFGLEHLEDHLQMGEDYSITSCPGTKIDPNPDGMYDSQTQAESLREQQMAEMNGSHTIASYLTAGELGDALKYVYRTARTAIEENGANSLFLALGMLRWFEDEQGTQPRYAPLLLLPVDMVRKGGGKYVIRKRDEDIIPNITLIELLKQNYQINLDNLKELPRDANGVDVRLVFAIVRQAVKPMQRWTVVEEALLGLFSFNKFVMWNDIHTNADLLKQNAIVASLIENRNKQEAVLDVVDARQIDRETAPMDFAIPLDVDSSQMEAIVESGRGRSFILHGPPGTGKSQTITNMIANALYQGKRVLFVAEKMAALSVVQQRLSKIGLGPFCLELHSNKATKRHFLEQMEAVLNAKRVKAPKEFAPASEELLKERKELAAYMEALHQKGASGLSLYTCITEYLALKCEEMDGEALPPTEQLTAELLSRCRAYPEQMDAVIQVTGQPAQHPLLGLEPRDNTLQTLEAIKAVLTQFSATYKTYTRQLAAMSGISVPFEVQTEAEVEWLCRFADCVAQGKACEDALEAIRQRYADDIVKLDVDACRREWNEACQKWFLPRYFAKKNFVKSMQRYGTIFEADIDAVLNQVGDYQQMLRTATQQDEEMGAYSHNLDIRYQERKQAFENHIAHSRKELRQNFLQDAAALRSSYAQLCQLANRYVQLSNPDQLSPFVTLSTMSDDWLAHFDLMRDWYLWVAKKRELVADGLSPVASMVEENELTPAEAADRFLKAAYHRLITLTIDQNPQLRMFNGLLFRQQIEKYKRDTRRFQELSKAELYSRLVSRVPSVLTAQADGSEVSTIKRAIASGGRGSSIRSIIDNIPTLLPRLCPCMLMSPISVAQYVDLRRDKFDLVIFDEASQMPTSEAVGAIARGNALIVVGDSKQMPPTSFFTTTQVDEEEAEVDDMESILDDCKTLSMREYYLSWHYRSKHESLIAFSNSQYYGNRLYTFPSVDDQTAKVRLVHVDGEYDKGHSRVNPEESRQIVAEVKRRLEDPILRQHSIGIVSFSKVQGDRIEDDLTDMLDRHPDLKEAALNRNEPIFVKNLENVQGDERDIILFSVGYGPDRDGKVSMNFGPLNNNGGERRLNVAVSRARFEMVVFSTLQSNQIDLRRSSAKGVEGLKSFLEYAETGHLPLTSADAESQGQPEMVKQLCEALRERGYVATPGVGRSNFKVDVAVSTTDNPSQYLLGILCDGQVYQETKTTRDREIVQPSVLNMLGWRVMRVYSVDWYENRDRVLAQISDELFAAVRGEQPAANDKPDYVFDLGKMKSVAPAEAVAHNAGQAAYVEAEVTTPFFDKANYTPAMPVNTQVLRQILSVEQPVLEGYLNKRLAKCLGFAHTTPNIQRAIDVAAKMFYQEGFSLDGQRTFWLNKESARNYTTYRAMSPRAINEIPAVEIANAVTEALHEEFSLPKERIPSVVAKKLGFSAAGAKISETILQLLTLMEQQGMVKSNGLFITLG